MLRDEVLGARVVLVDDDPAEVLLARRFLHDAGFRDVLAFSDPLDVRDHFVELAPDCVVVDVDMPGLGGYELMAAIEEQLPHGEFLPYLVLTSHDGSDTPTQAFQAGARAFLAKPFDADELVWRLAGLLDTRLLLRPQSEPGVEGFRSWTPDQGVEGSDVIGRLVVAHALCDDEPPAHNDRVGELAHDVAVAMGLDPSLCELIGPAARLHDVGKMAIPQYLVQAGRNLAPDDVRTVEAHTTEGAALLQAHGTGPLLDLAVQIARSHHERWDGTGYPNHLSGTSIPLAARIVAVCDAFVTRVGMLTEGWPVRVGLGKIRQGRGSQFDPAVVDAFERVLSSPAARAAS